VRLLPLLFSQKSCSPPPTVLQYRCPCPSLMSPLLSPFSSSLRPVPPLLGPSPNGRMCNPAALRWERELLVVPEAGYVAALSLGLPSHWKWRSPSVPLAAIGSLVSPSPVSTADWVRFRWSDPTQKHAFKLAGGCSGLSRSFPVRITMMLPLLPPSSPPLVSSPDFPNPSASSDLRVIDVIQLPCRDVSLEDAIT
jgi:hypothetical protein